MSTFTVTAKGLAKRALGNSSKKIPGRISFIMVGIGFAPTIPTCIAAASTDSVVARCVILAAGAATGIAGLFGAERPFQKLARERYAELTSRQP
jgi:hypothetical protein